MMNFGKLGAAVAVTAAVLTGTLAGATPAEALGFGDVLEFSTRGASNPNGATLKNIGGDKYEFDVGVIEIDMNSPFGPAGTKINDVVLKLKRTSNAGPGGLGIYELAETTPFQWLSGLEDGMGGFSRVYTLSSFTLEIDEQIRPGVLEFDAVFAGFFTPPTPGVQGLGGASGTGRIRTTGSTIAGVVEVVPTPAAVLPALLGMGSAAFRKKKQEEEEDLTAVEVNA